MARYNWLGTQSGKAQRRGRVRRRSLQLSVRALEALEERALMATGVNSIVTQSGLVVPIDPAIADKLGSDVAFLYQDYASHSPAAVADPASGAGQKGTSLALAIDPYTLSSD